MQRLSERYNIENPKGLLKNLQKEILKGNLRIIAQTTDGNAKGYVNYEGTLYPVAYDIKKKEDNNYFSRRKF